MRVAFLDCRDVDGMVVAPVGGGGGGVRGDILTVFFSRSGPDGAVRRRNSGFGRRRKVIDVRRFEGDDRDGAGRIRIAVFMSVFNVHVNRTPSMAS